MYNSKRALVRLWKDNAGVTWSNISEVDGRNYLYWMSNWDYAKKYQQKHGEVV
jgi:sucrose-6-phosphate hydrolase SacC (GH32 family)